MFHIVLLILKKYSWFLFKYWISLLKSNVFWSRQRQQLMVAMCQEIISMTVNVAFCFIHICYRINLHPRPRRKIRIEDFGSRTRDEMYRKHRPKVYCRLERSTMGSCFIKPRVYWNLFHPPVEEELCTRGEGLNITMRDPRRICMGTNINVTSCMKHIFFSQTSISWLWGKKYRSYYRKSTLGS